LAQAYELLLLNHVCLRLLQLIVRVSFRAHSFLEQPVLLLERACGPLAIGYIPENSLSADDPPRVVIDRGLDHLDVELVPLRRNVLLKRLKDFSPLHNQIVVAIAFGEISGKKVEITFSPQLFQRFTDLRTEAAISECEAAVQILAENILRKILHQ